MFAVEIWFCGCVVQFLQDEVDSFYEAAAANPELIYNSADVKLVYSSASEGEG
jgi:DnaJ family protein C protein 13